MALNGTELERALAPLDNELLDVGTHNSGLP